MRDGRYAIYRGKEYEFDREDDGQYYIIFRKPSMEEVRKLRRNGFYEEFENFYRKDVTKSEVECVYTINTVCKYKGHEFQVLGEQEDKYLITQLDLDIIGRGDDRKLVNKDEVTDIKEEKTVEYENSKLKDIEKLTGDSLVPFKRDKVKNKKNINKATEINPSQRAGLIAF